MNDFNHALAAALAAQGFILIPEPKFPDCFGGHVRGKLVYAKIVRPGISFRVYDNEGGGNPVWLAFARKTAGGVEHVGSTRYANLDEWRVPEHAVRFGPLSEALMEWRGQLNRQDIPCNKCPGNGIYVIGHKHGEPIETKCNRCSGKGFQNYNDQIANERYDSALKARAADFEKDEGIPLKEHWHPY